MSNDTLRFRGRWVLATCVLIGSLLTLASPAWGEPYPNVPTPTIEGPIPVTETSQIFMHTNVPLAHYGYVEEEYFISGTGYTYTTSGPLNETGTKILTGGPNENGTYPFKTRIVVRRPENPANFNGKVIAEWQNVSAGFDLEPQWVGDPYYLMKSGYAYVAVDAQNVGINGLKTFDNARYSSLQTGPSGDALSYDMYAAALKAIRGDGIGPEPLGDLTSHIGNVTASGASQSCGRLAIDYNKVVPLQEGIANDFLLTDCTSAIRADRPQKVLRVISETENRIEQTEAEYPTNPALRHWEAAAGTHVPFMVQANWGPLIEREVGPNSFAYCTHTPILSTVSWPYSVDVGVAELIAWSEGGPPPPPAPRGEYVNPTTLKRNDLGIALGGMRLPEAEVPVVRDLAENSAHAAPNPYPFSGFCVLLGQHQAFTEETLNGLYKNYGEYIGKVEADAAKLVTEGFLAPEGAARIVDAAEEFPALRPTVPVLSDSPPKTFQLTWRGPVPSYEESLVPKFVETRPTFEVQHRPAAGGEWTTVASSLGEPRYSLAGEEGGTWNYRVRSRTVVPAHQLEPEEVIVSPWSEASTAVTVLAGTVKGKLVVRAGQAVVLTATANVTGAVAVESGGALDVEGATLSGSLEASGAGLLRICGASVANVVSARNGSGPVVIGEGTAGCSASTFSSAVKVEGNTGGVSIDGNVFQAGLTVTGNDGGTTVTDNTVAGALTVTGNTGTVVDQPNKVAGKSTLQ